MLTWYLRLSFSTKIRYDISLFLSFKIFLLWRTDFQSYVGIEWIGGYSTKWFLCYLKELKTILNLIFPQLCFCCIYKWRKWGRKLRWGGLSSIIIFTTFELQARAWLCISSLAYKHLAVPRTLSRIRNYNTEQHSIFWIYSLAFNRSSDIFLIEILSLLYIPQYINWCWWKM